MTIYTHKYTICTICTHAYIHILSYGVHMHIHMHAYICIPYVHTYVSTYTIWYAYTVIDICTCASTYNHMYQMCTYTNITIWCAYAHRHVYACIRIQYTYIDNLHYPPTPTNPYTPSHIYMHRSPTVPLKALQIATHSNNTQTLLSRLPTTVRPDINSAHWPWLSAASGGQVGGIGLYIH